jgi:hypothetical protein
LISSSSVHNTVDGRAAVQCNHHANFHRCRTSPKLPPPFASDTGSTFRIDAWFTPTSQAQLRLLLDRDSPPSTIANVQLKRMQSGQVVCVRSRAFLPAVLLSREVNDQQKRMRCDVANFFLDTVSDKYGETVRCFLSLLRKRGALSVTSNTNDA